MRLKYIIMTLFLASSNLIFSQFLHTQEELEEIVNNNPDKYLLQETENLSQDAFSNCRIGTEKHNVQAVSTVRPTILTQDLSKASRKKLKKKNKKILKKVSLQPNDNDAIMELCANHFRLGNFDDALYYKLMLPKTAAPNFEDEFILAKSYLETKKYDLALNHAFNAKVLLAYQSNTEKESQKLVETLLTNTLKAQEKSYQDWTLQFSYCITTRDNKTYISFKSEPWKAYAVCKSVWLKDSVHKTKMATISDQDPWLVEEKECLLNTLISYMRHEADNPEFDGLKYLATALDKDSVKEFILYERFIAQYQPIPNGVPTKEELEKIKAYFLSAHSESLK